jgi:hypothetical protein
LWALHTTSTIAGAEKSDLTPPEQAAAMPFAFACPHCEAQLKVPVDPGGKKVQCPQCAKIFKGPANARDLNVARARRRLSEADDDSDESEERPRFKKKKKEKKSNRHVGLTLVVGLLLLGGIVFLVIMLLGGPSLDKELLAYAPDDTKVIAGVDVEKLIDHDKLKDPINKLLQGTGGQQFRDRLQQAGLTENDIEKVLLAGPDPEMVTKKKEPPPRAKNRGQAKGPKQAKDGKQPKPKPPPPPELVIVVKLKKGKSVDAERLKTSANATEVQKDGKFILKAKDFYLYQATDRIAIIAPTETSIAKVLGKDGKTISLAEPVMAMVQKAGTSHAWFAAATDHLSKNQGGPFAGIGPGAADIGAAFQGSKGFAFWGEAGSDRMELGFAVSCSSAETATKAAAETSKGLSQARKMMREVNRMFGGLGDDDNPLGKELIENTSATSDGELLILSTKLSIAPLVKIFNAEGATGLGDMLGIGGDDEPDDDEMDEPPPGPPFRNRGARGGLPPPGDE